jgi:hypothetical protein
MMDFKVRTLKDRQDDIFENIKKNNYPLYIGLKRNGDWYVVQEINFIEDSILLDGKEGKEICKLSEILLLPRLGFDRNHKPIFEYDIIEVVDSHFYNDLYGGTGEMKATVVVKTTGHGKKFYQTIDNPNLILENTLIDLYGQRIGNQLVDYFKKESEK